MKRLRPVYSLLIVILVILAQGTTVASASIVEISTYPDPNFADGAHWVQKVVFDTGEEVFLDQGKITPVALDGKVFWLEPLESQAHFIAVYGPALAPEAWTAQHNQALERATTLPPAACPPAQERTPTGVGKALPFCAGEPVVGFRITLVDNRSCTMCYLPKAPLQGTVEDGVVKPWPTEIGTSRVWNP